ncbi:MAG: hypothetical protein KAK00_02035 [Nanoarchaeota archaeon]|nr:hypothetical protein [Nanoarchaeota archaeon]
MILPALLRLQKFIEGWRGQIIPGVILIIVFSIWTGIEEHKEKKKKIER